MKACRGCEKRPGFNLLRGFCGQCYDDLSHGGDRALIIAERMAKRIEGELDREVVVYVPEKK